MKKILAIQIFLLIIFSASFFGMLIYSDVFSDIKTTIVDQTCFSCIKMDPISKFEFTFETVDNKPHPSFIIENLTKGPIFLAFRADICTACDIMEPVIMDLFNVEFGKKELFYQIINYSGNDIVFYHININPPYEIETESFYIYDKDRREGVPMFVFITLGDNNGKIQPFYITSYSTLGLNNNEKRKEYFQNFISTGVDFYMQNIEKYKELNRII
jgi:hypothetical protein